MAGSIGLRGPRGPGGVPGNYGYQGNQGDTGGPQGPQGNQGNQGSIGQRGVSNVAVSPSFLQLTTLKGQPTYFYKVPAFTWNSLEARSTNYIAGSAIGTGTHEAFLNNSNPYAAIYVGAYPASIVNGEVVCQPGMYPATSMNMSDAMAACAATTIVEYIIQARLMSVWDWSALMFWCIANGFQPFGNNSNGAWGLTGSMPALAGAMNYVPTSAGGNNTTSLSGSMGAISAHNGTLSGIFDLVGNVWDMLQGAFLQNGQLYLSPDNGLATPVATGYWLSGPPTSGLPSIINNTTITPSSGVANCAFNAILTTTVSQALLRAGLAPMSSTTTGYHGSVIYRGGYMFDNQNATMLLSRGGSYADGDSAGLSAINLTSTTGNSPGIGFRPAFAI